MKRVIIVEHIRLRFSLSKRTPKTDSKSDHWVSCLSLKIADRISWNHSKPHREFCSRSTVWRSWRSFEWSSRAVIASVVYRVGDCYRYPLRWFFERVDIDQQRQMVQWMVFVDLTIQLLVSHLRLPEDGGMRWTFAFSPVRCQWVHVSTIVHSCRIVRYCNVFSSVVTFKPHTRNRIHGRSISLKTIFGNLRKPGVHR